MAHKIRKVDYYDATVHEAPSEACSLLAQLAETGVDLLAFTAIPTGPRRTQFTIIPAENPALVAAAKRAGLELDGPHPALFVQGDDELGALAAVHESLQRAGVEVYAATGIAQGAGTFGYVVYVRPETFDLAVAALELR